jgi:hypothetical protein
MSKLIRLAPRTPKGFNDIRSTGATRPLGKPDVDAARGTLKRPR